MKLENFHETFNSLHIGTEEPRSFFIPVKVNEKYDVEQWQKSSSVKLLNGNWDICFYDNFKELINSDDIINFPIDKSVKIKVPGCWQTQGFDHNQYTNIRYPIPLDPPYVPDINPMGLYRTVVNLESSRNKQREFIVFDGVDSCFYLWVNGNFIGYSSVSHSISEFEVSSYLHSGDNEIKVLVLKWGCGSYLEDQDKFRMTGIFRDVYILSRPENYIRDFKIDTDFDIVKNKGYIDCQIEKTINNLPVTVRIMDADENLCYREIINDNFVHIEIDNPKLWNAEVPYLYKMVLTTKKEKIVKYVGIKKIEIKDGIFYLNNQNIKFKGVNRHDSDPVTGFTISIDQLKKDLILMKKHNINAIRTSHYPNAPWAYDLYDKMGFYVICESDVETHGNELLYNKSNTAFLGNDMNQLFFENPKSCRMANDPSFENMINDRVMRNCAQQRNATCRVFWSLGNESGYGKNFESAIKSVKLYDRCTPIHYEGMIYYDSGISVSREGIDVYSRMYPTYEFCEHYGRNKLLNLPFVCCEYMHSMGNGPGGIEDYWDIFYKYDNLSGGFAWEWCDHAVLDDKNHYLYGGDSNEIFDDGNFCVDGLVTPDRQVKPGLLEYKNVLRPIRISLYQNFSSNEIFIKVKNCLDFLSLKDAVSIKYTCVEDGEKIDSDFLDINLKPHEECIFFMKVNFLKEHSFKQIFFEYSAKENCLGVFDNYNLGFDTLLIEDNYDFLAIERNEYNKNSYKLSDLVDKFVISGNNFEYTFSKYKAQFISIKRNGIEILDGDITWNIWRAPTDNDMHIVNEWRAAGYHFAKEKVLSVNLKVSDDSIYIITKTCLQALGQNRIMNIETSWIIDNRSGRIHVKSKVDKTIGLPALPRFGLKLILKKEYEDFSYWGYGPHHSYVDLHESCYEGMFISSAEKEYVDYIYPQEHGSHYGVRSLCLFPQENKENFIPFYFEKPVSINVSHYTPEELTNKRHNFELEKSGKVIVCIDYKQNGIGSNSCGPALNYKYLFDQMQFNFEFYIF